MATNVRRSAIALPLLLALLAACGSQGKGTTAAAGTTSGTGGGAHSAATGGSITVGALVPQTGPNAVDGQSALNGINLAIDQVNAAGGVNGQHLSVNVVDNRSSNEGTVTGFTKLTSGGKLAAIVGPSVSSEVSAAAPYISKAGIPFFFGGTLPTLTHSGNQWLFRTRPTDQYFAKAIADYGVKDLHINTWAVLHATDVFGTAADKYLVSDLKADGASVLSDAGYQPGTTDFTSVVLSLKKSGAKGLASFVTSAEDYGVFANQLRQLGVDNSAMTWVASGSAVTAPSLKLASNSLQGVSAVTDYVANGNSAATAFVTAYKAKYNTAPDVNAAYAYDAVGLLAAAIKKAGTTDPAAVRTALLGLHDYQGVLGTFNFDQYGDGAHTVSVVTVKNGTPTYVQALQLPDVPYIAP